MAEFDESKHKRDELGRFAQMSAKEISNEIKIEIGEHKYIEAKNNRVPISSLTSTQWRLWYQEQTQREKSYLLGEYSERRIVDVEGIFILTSGDFDSPKVEAIYKFNDNEKSIACRKVLDKNYGRI